MEDEMLRICFYHWIPLADNMLPDIAKSLVTQKNATISENTVEHVLYESNIDTESDKLGKLHIKGKINSRGFSQYIINIPPPRNMALGPVIESTLPKLHNAVSSFIFDILPYAVRNKIGVMEESIVSFQRFESTVFETFVDNLSKRFLKTYSVVAILVDDVYEQDIKAGFIIDGDNVSLNITSNNNENFFTCSENESVFFFYSKKFAVEEQKEFESVIYKYCALVAYARFVERVVDILKDVRDHIIPLRRQLAIALQRNTEEHFNWMTRIKKYLTYIKIKLPIIQRVINHLASANRTGVKLKLDLFKNSANINSFPSLVKAQEHLIKMRMKPLNINDIINEALERSEKLFDEADRENGILSTELTQVLQGSLQSEQVQITTRELDTSRSILELDRGGKNRSNALKILSLVLSGSLGVQFATAIVDIWNFYSKYQIPSGGSAILKGVLLLVFPAVAWLLADKYIQRKSDLFRLVIPVLSNIPSESISRYLTDYPSNYNRHEISGQRNTVSWSQTLFPILNKPQYTRLPYLFKRIPLKYKFNMVFDYEKRGYVHSITLEAEHNKIKFDVFGLVVQILSSMDKSGCLSEYQRRETSLLAEVLMYLGINLRDDLIGLNKILATSSDELQRDLEGYKKDTDDPSLSNIDRDIMKDIMEKNTLYLDWLIDAQEDKHENIPLSLLGRSNVAKKLTVLRVILPTFDFVKEI